MTFRNDNHARTNRKAPVSRTTMSLARSTAAVGIVVASVVTSPALAQTKQVVSESFACSSQDYFKKAVAMAVQKDEEAFTRMLANGIATGQCVFFERGAQVHVQDVALFAGLTQIRRRGSTKSYWTYIEAVK